MLTKEEQRIVQLANGLIRPVMVRVDYLEKELRRVKSEVNNMKSQLDQLKNRR